MEGGSPAMHSHQSLLSDDQAMDARRDTVGGRGALREVNGLHRTSGESGGSFSTVIGARGWTTGK